METSDTNIQVTVTMTGSSSQLRHALALAADADIHPCLCTENAVPAGADITIKWHNESPAVVHQEG